MDRFVKVAEYTEDQQHSEAVLLTHVAHRTVNLAACGGSGVVVAYRALNSLRGKAMTGSMMGSLLRTNAAALLIGTAAGVAMTEARMAGKTTVEWQDRAYRVLNSAGQNTTDEWSAAGGMAGFMLGLSGLGVANGGKTASVGTARSLSLTVRTLGGAGLGSVVGLLSMVGYQSALKAGLVDVVAEKVKALRDEFVALFAAPGLSQPIHQQHAHDWVTSDALGDGAFEVLCATCGLHISEPTSATSISNVTSPASKIGASKTLPVCSHFVTVSETSHQLSWKCNICHTGSTVTVIPSQIPSNLMEQIVAGRPLSARIAIVKAMMMYARGFLRQDPRPVNPFNPKGLGLAGGPTPQVVAVMDVLGFDLKIIETASDPTSPLFIPRFPADSPHNVNSVDERDAVRVRWAMAELHVFDLNLRCSSGDIPLDQFHKAVRREHASEFAHSLFGAKSNPSALASVDKCAKPTLQHYIRLGCLPSVSDKNLETAFTTLLKLEPASKSLILDSMLEIAALRGALLQEFIIMERSRLNLFTTQELTSAYTLLNLTPPNQPNLHPSSYPAHVLIGVFQASAMELPQEIDSLRDALRTCAMDQGCWDDVDIFLQTGFMPRSDSNDIIDFQPDEPIDASMPRGLQNFGNICYLNALLQFFRTIKPFRESILDAVPPRSKEERSPSPANRSNESQSHHCIHFLQRLQILFKQLSDGGSDSAVRSVAMDRELAAAILAGPNGGYTSRGTSPVRGSFMDTEEQSKQELQQQQDVGEFMDVFVDMVEKGFDALGRRDVVQLIKRLFYGTTVQTLVTAQSENSSHSASSTVAAPTEDDFLYLLIDLRPDIYASLDAYFETTKVDYDGGSLNAVRSVALKRLPPILTFQFRRVQYDLTTNSAFKANDFVKFYDTLDLGRYFTSQSPNRRSSKYRLHAVLEHEGDAGYGHYRSIIRDHSTNTWILYDDSRVSKITDVEDRVFGGRGGNRDVKNAYCLMYVAEDEVGEVA
ncbi:ubiquitin-specific protease ubp2 [Chytriomyces hyalinus]|nr:ubiquitin-specific protease ubp2 [Chytriomyces hyalinus]